MSCSGFAHGFRLSGGVREGPVAVESYGLDFHRGILDETGLRTAPLTVDPHGARIDDVSSTRGLTFGVARGRAWVRGSRSSGLEFSQS